MPGQGDPVDCSGYHGGVVRWSLVVSRSVEWQNRWKSGEGRYEKGPYGVRKEPLAAHLGYLIVLVPGNWEGRLTAPAAGQERN